jgi:hypothetical protein
MKIDWGKTLTSKLVWTGIIEVLIGIFGYLATIPEGARAMAVIAGCLTILFRFLTKDTIVK